MSEPSLAYTATTFANQYEMIKNKLWFKMSTQDSVFTTWQTWANASGTTQQKAIAAKFSGRVMDFTVTVAAIPGFPGHSTYTASNPPNIGFVKKWGGACMKDHSSGMGGFCLFETNDTPFYDCHHIDGTTAAPGYDGSSAAKILVCGTSGNCGGLSSAAIQTGDSNAYCGVSSTGCTYETNQGAPVNIYWDRQINSGASSAAKGTVVYKKDSNRDYMFLRLTAAQFTTMEAAWSNTSLKCDVSGPSSALNFMDGRAYYLSVRTALIDKSSATTYAYFDYPQCTLNASTDTYSCQMFMPARALQTAGYAAFDQPGVVKAYFVTPYIPNVEVLALATSQETFGASSAVWLSAPAVGALVAGIFATMF